MIFADEPTGSLDSLTGEKVMDLMTGLAREQGSTVVIVTHDARVAAYADRVVMVRDGLLIAVERGRSYILRLCCCRLLLARRARTDVPAKPAAQAAQRP